MKDPFKVVHTVLVTEKATELSDELNKYTFRVSRDASKVDIRRAVETIFDVRVGAVNVMNRKGKSKRVRYGRFGTRADWKKAVVTLTEGSIDVL